MFRVNPNIPCLVLAALAVLSGCSYSYVDDNGNRYVVGLVKIEIKPETPSSTFAGNVVGVETLGLAVARGTDQSSIALGYSKTATAYLRDHSLAIGDILGLDAQVANQLSSSPPIAENDEK